MTKSIGFMCEAILNAQGEVLFRETIAQLDLTKIEAFVYSDEGTGGYFVVMQSGMQYSISFVQYEILRAQWESFP